MVSHAKGEDTFVEPEAFRVEGEVGRLFVDGLDDELFVVEGNVADFRPRKSNLWRKGQGAFSEMMED